MPQPFALETVLRLRQRREEGEERALAALGVQRQQALAMLERVQQEMRQWSEERVREAGRVAPAAMQQMGYARLKLLQEGQAQLTAQLRELEGRRQLQQASYLAARSAREMLSELKQQQRVAQAAAVERREQRQVEDVFRSRYKRS